MTIALTLSGILKALDTYYSFILTPCEVLFTKMPWRGTKQKAQGLPQMALNHHTVLSLRTWLGGASAVDKSGACQFRCLKGTFSCSR